MNTQELKTGMGQAIARARERRGWSQSDLAKKGGLHPSTINKVEAGDRWPSADVLGAILSALDRHLTGLLIGDERESFSMASRMRNLSLPVRGALGALLAALQPTQPTHSLGEAPRDYGADETDLVSMDPGLSIIQGKLTRVWIRGTPEQKAGVVMLLQLLESATEKDDASGGHHE